MSASRQLLLNMQQISLYATMVHHVISAVKAARSPRAIAGLSQEVRVPPPTLLRSLCATDYLRIGVGAVTRGVVLRHEQLGGRCRAVGGAVGAVSAVGGPGGADPGDPGP